MPGLYGIANFREKPDPAPFDRLGERMTPKKGKSFTWHSEKISIGFKSLGIVDLDDQPFVDDNMTLFFWGEVFSPLPGHTHILKHIMSLYRDEELFRLGEINGFFSFALWDNKKETLILGCDIHGTRPLYYTRQSGMIVFGPNPFAVANALEYMEMDGIAMHQFLAFSTMFEDHTWIENVRKLQYGQYLKFNASGREVIRYFIPTRDVAKMTLDEAAENTLNLLNQSVNRMTSGKTAISLSGGGDSRLIAAICKRNNIPIKAFTFGSAESEDIRIAKEVANALEAKHHPLLIQDDFLKGYIRQAVYNTGGYVSAVNFHGISTRAEVKKFCNICLSGLYGNNHLGYLSFNLLKFLACRNEKSFRRKLSEWLAHDGVSPLNHDAITLEMIRRSTDKLLKTYRQKTYYETIMMIDHFEINAQRSLAGTWLENDTLEFRSPYCDRDLLKFNLTIPRKYLLLMRLGRRIWQRHFPELGNIKYQRTGLRLTASIWQVLRYRLKHRSDTDRLPPGIMDYDYIYHERLKDWIKEFLTSKQSLMPVCLHPYIWKKSLEDFKISQVAKLLVIEQVLRILHSHQ
jgi:asparagine synthetase B (glutamine-hydrolysing)